MPSFSFLNSSFLMMLPLVGVPVLIHLISRKKIQVLDYPSLKFLREAYMKRMKYVKLNELLLLLVRAAIVCLLVLAFSRFAAFVPGLSPSGAGRFAVIIDDSFSAEYAAAGIRISDRIKKEALETISKSAAGSKYLIVRTSQKNIAQDFLSAEKAMEEIKSIRTSFHVRSLADTINALSRTENYSGLSAVYVFSDFLTSERNDIIKLSDLLKSNAVLQKGPKYELVRSAPEELNELAKNRNLSIYDLAVSEERVTVGRPFSIKGKVRNHSILAATVEVSLFQDEALAAKVPVGVDARTETEFSVSHSFINGGEYSMRLSLPEDQVAEDNNCFLVVRPVSSLYVLILYREDLRRSETADYRYLATALNPANSISFKDGLVIQPVALNLNAHAPGDFDNYDAVIVAGVETLDAASIEKLNNFVSAGGGVLFLPPQNGNLASFTRTFSSLTPVVFDADAAPVTSPGENNYFNFTDVAYEHPVFSIFKNRNSGDITLPRFYRVIPTEERNIAAPASTTVLARFERNVPALLERRVGRGVALAFMGYMDTMNSNFTSSALFVPFVHQVFYHINRNRFENARPQIVDTPITASFGHQDKVTSVACRAPGADSEFKLDIKPARGNFTATFSETSTSGIYSFFKKTDEKIIISKFAVNSDPRESINDVSEYVAAAEILSRGGLLKNPATPGVPPAEKRLDLAPYLFVLMLALMAAESFLVMRTRD